MNREQAKDAVKDRIEEYLQGKGINTRKNFKCLNPAHADNKGDMSFYRPSKQCICHCGAKYDIFDLIGMDYGLTEQADIFKKAYELFNISIDKEPIKEDKAAQIAKKTEKEAPEARTDYTAFFLQANKNINSAEAVAYLNKRGISAETAARFCLGYDPAWKHPKAPDYAPATPRLIIPVTKYTYLARDTRDTIPDDQQEYKKSKVKGTNNATWIFNYKALQTADKPVIVVEGEIDALSVIEAGGEAVALGSTAYVKAFIKLVEAQKPVQPLILSLDNEAAGKKAEDELSAELERLKIPFYRHNISGQAKDANDALIADRDAFIEAVAEAENIEAAALELEKDHYLKTSAKNYIQAFEAEIDDGRPAISTGFYGLDEKLGGGLFPDLYIMGAISSLGKTTLIMQIADNIATRGGDVIIFSLEMGRSELMAKSISRLTLLPILQKKGNMSNARTVREIMTGQRYSLKNSRFEVLTTDEKDRIKAATAAYSKYAGNIYIKQGIDADRETDIGIDEIEAAISKHISFTGKRPVVVIDYLQIIAPPDIRATDKQNMDKTVKALKRLSVRYKVPVVCVSSLNRGGYSEPVTMEAFKESGAIEYGADCLIGLQLKGVGDKKTFNVNEAKKKNPREVELVILKQRNGSTGEKVDFNYYPLFNYFNEPLTGLNDVLYDNINGDFEQITAEEADDLPFD